MKPKDFKRWRRSLGLSQKAAAEALGLKRRVVQYYEKGERDGKDVGIPKAVRLACYALSEGVSDYHGPREGEALSRPLTNGAANDAEHAEEMVSDIVALRPEDAKKSKRDKDKSKDKGREKDKGKGKERGKRENALAHDEH